MHNLGETLPLWSASPFAGLLLSIAILPLLAAQFWHRHYPKVTLAWALLFAVPFLAAFRGEALHEMLQVLLADYVPFVILLGALFTISGGIVLRGTLRGTPRTNVALLAIGTALASWIGTTGASMLLLRPVLRVNATRARRAHIVVFFIFLVSNVGGALTPLGDPPLFLGFLRGVPFFWTLHLLPHTLLVAGILLVVFYLLDRRMAAREAGVAHHAPEPPEPLRIAGGVNMLLLGGVIAAVLLSGVVHLGAVRIAGIERPVQDLLRDAALILLAAASLRAVPRDLRLENSFGWGPMREVAILFAGIFVTILPALAILRAGAQGDLAPVVRAAAAPAQYFWLTGGLSSFLDNAPTYLTFVATALGRFFADVPPGDAVQHLLREQGRVLEAISAGAVYMGAMTYIGNAPNFMVRSIAEEAGVAMPSFFGYLLRWSLPVLVPVFLLVTLVFFR